MDYVIICAVKTVLKLHSHPLKLKCDPYSHGSRCRWFCDQCRRTVTNVEELSWHCDQCGYDECEVCHSKQSRLMIATQLALVETHENIFDDELRLTLVIPRLAFESPPAPRVPVSIPTTVAAVPQNDSM